MSIARVCLPQDRPLTSLGFVFLVGVLAAWLTMTPSDEGRAAPAPTPVLISVTTLDMSSLVPAQFGDWDVAVQPTR